MSTSMTKSETEEWIKIDLHIHTLDDPKDAVDYSAHQLLERARTLGFRVLAITLHDAVFGRKKVFADAARRLNFYNCAASFLYVRRLDWIAITSRNRLLRRDRVLPFSRWPV